MQQRTVPHIPRQTRVLLVEELVALAVWPVLAAVLLDDDQRLAVRARFVGNVGVDAERRLGAAQERDEVGVGQVAWGVRYWVAM